MGDQVTFSNAYFLKLGEGGRWEADSINRKIARIGWSQITLNDLIAGNWDVIEPQVRREHTDKGAGTRDFRELRRFCDSTSADLWITFHNSCLWWGRLSDDRIQEDHLSKFRTMDGGWCDKSTSGRILYSAQVPGQISKVQGYRGTVCSVKGADKASLSRLINGEAGNAFHAIENSREALKVAIAEAVRELHWKDFETLVDLVFREAGWKRVSTNGETMKGVDSELEEPITRYKYQVQVKSKATLAQFKEFETNFQPKKFHKSYFVVHSPDKQLATVNPMQDSPIELVLPSRLSTFIIDAGLTDWLMEKVR